MERFPPDPADAGKIREGRRGLLERGGLPGDPTETLAPTSAPQVAGDNPATAPPPGLPT